MLSNPAPNPPPDKRRSTKYLALVWFLVGPKPRPVPTTTTLIDAELGQLRAVTAGDPR